MKKNILIGYNYILHYRVPLFNKLSERYEVTVLHSGKKMVTDQDLYREIIVPVYKIGPIHLQPGLIKELINPKYSVVIVLFDVAWLTTLISVISRNKKRKFILWGAWITNNRFANYVRLNLTKIADANIFYTHQAKMDFIKMNINEEKLFVANNTFDVGIQLHSYTNKLKNRILFVGSLDERKQNDILINAFKNIISKIPKNIILTIVGDGLQFNSLVNLVASLNLKNRVEFLGRINNNDLLKEQYKNAIVSVSFGQAGLTVLQSLGYGVPFLTKKNAISGGEITNIKNNYNGILCEDNIKSLEDNLIKLCSDIPLARKLGENAFNYYLRYCTIENMAQGFIDAIEDTRVAKIDISN